MSKNQILAGFHAIRARLIHNPSSVVELYYDQSRRDKRLQQLLDQAKHLGCQIKETSSQHLDEVSKGVKHQGVVALAKKQELAVSLDEVFDVVEGPLFLLILDGVTDPHNLGACLRTADAVGVHAVVAPKNRAVSINATVRRVACGAADTVPYIKVTNLARTLRSLKERDVWVIGTSDQATDTLYDVDAKASIAWVLGAEGDGIRQLTEKNCDQLVQIPMAGSVESLNVSVATGVCLYETIRQRSVK